MIYLSLDGLPGMSDFTEEPETIELESFHTGFGQKETGIKKQPCSLPLQIKKICDASSPMLYKLCWSQNRVKKAKITVYHGGHENFSVLMEGMIVKNVDIKVNKDENSREHYTLLYNKITYTYKKISKDGNPEGFIPVSYSLYNREIN